MTGSISSPRGRRALASFLLLVLVGLSGACGGSDSAEQTAAEPDHDRPSGWSLLQRGPDRLRTNPGVLTPDPAEQWGPLGPVGWDGRTHWRDGAGYVWSRMTIGRLVLPAGTRADRTLSIDCWTPPLDEGETETLTVRLNGIEVGTAEVDHTPRTVAFETPAVLWQEGDNALELEVPQLRMPGEGNEVKIRSMGKDSAAGIALARVEYGEPRVPTLDPALGLLALQADTAVQYDVQAVVPIDLDVAAVPTGPGRLRLSVSLLDADTGEIVEERKGFDVALTEGGIDRRFPIASKPGELLRLSVGWSSPSGAELRVDRLQSLDHEPVERFPIILLAIDTLAARHVSAYGYGRETTPNLDALAKDGVLFEHCVPNSTWTLPSFLSLMSGQFANSNRVDGSKLPAGFDRKVIELWEMWAMPDNRWTLAEALRGMGWQTAGFVDSWWLSDRFQFTQGFDKFDITASYNDQVDPDGGIRMVTELALKWLDGDGIAPSPLSRGPFFLFLHCFDAHGPYASEEQYEGRFDGDGLHDPEHTRLAGLSADVFGGIQAYITSNEYAPGETPRELATAPITTLYDEGIALADDGVGALLAELKERGIYDDAMIIVTSDHGETTATEDLPFGHSVLDESVTHVPLIVKLPRGANAGRRVKQTVQLVDVYPTILDRVGLPLKREMLHGRSLMPLMNGESMPDVPTLCEGGIVRQAAVHQDGWKLVARMPAHESGDKGLITYPGIPKDWLREHFPELLEGGLTDELYARYTARADYQDTVQELRQMLDGYVDTSLYHLSEDPFEQHDLAEVEPGRVAEMYATLRDLVQLRDDAQAVAKPPTATVTPSAQDLEALEALGYAGK